MRNSRRDQNKDHSQTIPRSERLAKVGDERINLAYRDIFEAKHYSELKKISGLEPALKKYITLAEELTIAKRAADGKYASSVRPVSVIVPEFEAHSKYRRETFISRFTDIETVNGTRN